MIRKANPFLFALLSGSVIVGSLLSAGVTTALAEDASEQKSRIDDRADKEKARIDKKAQQDKERVNQRADREKQAIDDRKDGKKTTKAESSTSEDVSDAWITTKVKAKFLADKELKSTGITVVTADRGAVVLTGTVPSIAARERAVSLANHIKGVRTVQERLTVNATP